MSHFASPEQLLNDTFAGGVVRNAERFVFDVLAEACRVDFDGGLWNGLIQAGIAGRPRVAPQLIVRWFRTSAQGRGARGRRPHRERIGPAAHRRDLHVFQHLCVLSVNRLRFLMYYIQKAALSTAPLCPFVMIVRCFVGNQQSICSLNHFPSDR